jgi:hypothetical protein
MKKKFFEKFPNVKKDIEKKQDELIAHINSMIKNPPKGKQERCRAKMGKKKFLKLLKKLFNE